MRAPPDFSTRDRAWFHRLAAFALLFVQAVVLLTPLIEGRAGVGPTAHVEAYGSQKHYSHTEATCAFCSQYSIHPFVVAPQPAPVIALGSSTAGPQLQTVALPSFTGRSTLSRAPPLAS